MRVTERIPTWDIPIRDCRLPAPESAFSRKYQQFRTLLTDARLHAGLTQASLAKKLGRPQSFVSKFENGERRLDLIEFLDVARAIRLDPIRVIDELSRK